MLRAAKRMEIELCDVRRRHHSTQNSSMRIFLFYFYVFNILVGEEDDSTAITHFMIYFVRNFQIVAIFRYIKH